MRYFLKCSLLLLTIFMFSAKLKAQEGSDEAKTRLGLGIQVYPAGTIINAKMSWAVGNKSAVIGKIGYNIAERQDFGKHDQEDGGGPGFALAYQRYFNSDRKGFYVEARTGVWFLDIDWQDNAPLRNGSTDITVFQPTLGIGYDFALNNGKILLGGLVAFGYEVNVITSGEPVGEGGISLFAISATFPLN